MSRESSNRFTVTFQTNVDAEDCVAKGSWIMAGSRVSAIRSDVARGMSKAKSSLSNSAKLSEARKRFFAENKTSPTLAKANFTNVPCEVLRPRLVRSYESDSLDTTLTEENNNTTTIEQISRSDHTQSRDGFLLSMTSQHAEEETNDAAIKKLENEMS